MWLGLILWCEFGKAPSRLPKLGNAMLLSSRQINQALMLNRLLLVEFLFAVVRVVAQ